MKNGISSDCCVLVSDAFSSVFIGLNFNISTLVLTIGVPFDIQQYMNGVFLTKENQEWILFPSGRVAPDASQFRGQMSDCSNKFIEIM